ncbi:hypothetical protein CBR_g19604 [Chara braunii]|uniref:RRM domain-containing protein n=1 Tax=Chara braunii TaxID=69332 RepID=A0A388KYH6_CHABU|nr:hypothetical protein CBR_g19604 [Chara braunii]|eukprot:GBG75091.1 hypothetical protein CBR_g19604 [Chara braunii]
MEDQACWPGFQARRTGMEDRYYPHRRLDIGDHYQRPQRPVMEDGYGPHRPLDIDDYYRQTRSRGMEDQYQRSAWLDMEARYDRQGRYPSSGLVPELSRPPSEGYPEAEDLHRRRVPWSTEEHLRHSASLLSGSHGYRPSQLSVEDRCQRQQHLDMQGRYPDPAAYPLCGPLADLMKLRSADRPDMDNLYHHRGIRPSNGHDLDSSRPSPTDFGYPPNQPGLENRGLQQHSEMRSYYSHEAGRLAGIPSSESTAPNSADGVEKEGRYKYLDAGHRDGYELGSRSHLITGRDSHTNQEGMEDRQYRRPQCPDADGQYHCRLPYPDGDDRARSAGSPELKYGQKLESYQDIGERYRQSDRGDRDRDDRYSWQATHPQTNDHGDSVSGLGTRDANVKDANLYHEMKSSASDSRQESASCRAHVTAGSLSAGHSDALASEWYYLDEANQHQGPYLPSQLQELLSLGTIHYSTMLWAEGRTDWYPLSSIPELYGFVFERAVHLRAAAVSADADGRKEHTQGSDVSRPRASGQGWDRELASSGNADNTNASTVSANGGEERWKRESRAVTIRESLGTYQAKAGGDNSAAKNSSGSAIPSEATLDPDIELQRFKEEMRRVEMEVEAAKRAAKRAWESSGKREEEDEDDEEEGEVAGRGHPTQFPRGEGIFVDDEGAVYRWDRQLRMWVQQGGDAPIHQQFGPEDMVEMLQRAKTRGQGKAASVGQSQKLNASSDVDWRARQHHQQQQQQQQYEVSSQAKVSTVVYVSGLPQDATVVEVADVFSRCGLIREDPTTKQPRIKLYVDKSTGRHKGDGLVTYVRELSAELAVKVLDGTPLRAGDQRKMWVSQAEFEQKVEHSVKRPATTKKKKTKLKHQQDEDPPLAGSASVDDRSRATSGMTVIMRNMFSVEELVADPNLITELESDVWEECSKLGTVQRLKVYEKHPEGIVMVKFTERQAGFRCIHLMNGRWFGGRKIVAREEDGLTNYALGGFLPK